MIEITEIANGHGVLFACSGNVDAKELAEAKRRLPERFPTMASWYFCVVDLSPVDNLTASSTDMDLLVEQDLRFAKIARPRLPFAVIARSDYAFGVSRMWQSVSDVTEWQTAIFRERAAAESWIRKTVRATFEMELPSLQIEPVLPPQP